jgi:hypothetical protein
VQKPDKTPSAAKAPVKKTKKPAGKKAG